MAANGNKNRKNGTEQSAASLAMSLGFAIAIPLVLCIVGGVALDNWLNKSPLFVLIGVFLGLFISGFQLWQLAQAGMSEYGDNDATKSRK